MIYISWSSDFYLLFFALKNILVILAKPDSGELHCPATALIVYGICLNIILSWMSNVSTEVVFCGGNTMFFLFFFPFGHHHHHVFITLSESSMPITATTSRFCLHPNITIVYEFSINFESFTHNWR